METTITKWENSTDDYFSRMVEVLGLEQQSEVKVGEPDYGSPGKVLYIVF